MALLLFPLSPSLHCKLCTTWCLLKAYPEMPDCSIRNFCHYLHWNCSTNLKIAQVYKISLSSHYLWPMQMMKSLQMLNVFIWLSVNWLFGKSYHNVIHCINELISTYDVFCSLLMDICTLNSNIITGCFQL